MTLRVDAATSAKLAEVAAALGKTKSDVVREAIRDHVVRLGRLTDPERQRLLGAFDDLVPTIPFRSADDVEAELAELRSARYHGGRDAQ
jgi:hypothetical protein